MLEERNFNDNGCEMQFPTRERRKKFKIEYLDIRHRNNSFHPHHKSLLKINDKEPRK